MTNNKHYKHYDPTWQVVVKLTTSKPFPREKIILTKRYESKYNIGEDKNYIVFNYKEFTNLK